MGRRSVAEELDGFANVSLGEDIHFTDRALGACKPFSIVHVPAVYVRHGLNTWNGFEPLSWPTEAAPPPFVTPELSAELHAAALPALERALPAAEDRLRLLHRESGSEAAPSAASEAGGGGAGAPV